MFGSFNSETQGVTIGAWWTNDNGIGGHLQILQAPTH